MNWCFDRVVMFEGRGKLVKFPSLNSQGVKDAREHHTASIRGEILGTLVSPPQVYPKESSPRLSIEAAGTTEVYLNLQRDYSEPRPSKNSALSALSMALRHIHEPHDHREVKDLASLVKSQSMMQLRSAARRFGAHANVYESASFEEILTSLRNNRVVISQSSTLPRRENQIVVVNGARIDEQGERFLSIIDPTFVTSSNQKASFELNFREFERGNSGINRSKRNSEPSVTIVVVAKKDDALPQERLSGMAQALDAIGVATEGIRTALVRVREKLW